jgi:hypothetical protein
MASPSKQKDRFSPIVEEVGQSAFRTVVNGEMSLRRLKLSICEVVTPREEEAVEEM